MIKLYLSSSTQEKNICVDKTTEEQNMFKLANDVKNKIKHIINVKRNNNEMGVSQIVADSNNFNPDFHLSLHSNAGGQTGIEAWIHNNSIRGNKMAVILLNNLQPVLNIKLRQGRDGKAKETTIDNNTTFAEVDKTNAPACLLELFFHDNATEMNKFREKYDVIVDTISKSILEYFGLN